MNNLFIQIEKEETILFFFFGSQSLGGPTAQIIERKGWKCDKDFVGHRKAVNCVVSIQN